MEGTVGEDPRGLVEAMVSIAVYAGPGGTALLFVIGLLGILGGLVDGLPMLMRTGFLVLMAAALPIAGAAGGTKIGSQAFDKMIAWTIAWLWSSLWVPSSLAARRCCSSRRHRRSRTPTTGTR
ncbi:hypothetical protein GS474_10515 [Rhodococcus hoagii]|nr:hypothetical protein [Prescottella equi]